MEKKNQKQTPVLIFLFGILLIFLYQGILPIFYSALLKNFLASENPVISTLANLGYYLLFAGILWIIYHKSLKEEWNTFRKKKKELSKIALSNWIMGFLLMIISNLIVLSILGNIAPNESQNRDIIAQAPVFAITLMCLIGPFIEEVVFRKSMKDAFQNKYAFIIVTSLIFASLHVLNGFNEITEILNWKQWLFLVPYSSLAMFFAKAYYETDNIFTSTLAHMVHNTLTVLLILLTTFIK